MKERIITALIMLAVIAGILFFAPSLFTPLVAVVLGIATWEWCRICQFRQINAYGVAIATVALWVIASVYPAVLTALLILSALHYLYAIRLIVNYERIDNYRIHRYHLRWFGPVLLSALAASFLYLFHPSGSLMSSSEDAQSLLFIIMVIAGADSGAYFVGRAMGRHKLAPRVSPKKTIEGLIGGLVAVTLVVAVFGFMVEGWYLGFWQLLFISVVAALFSVIGDLFISIIKRQNGIKDTSQILPGHGGILDRVDGLLAGVPVFYLLEQFL